VSAIKKLMPRGTYDFEEFRVQKNDRPLKTKPPLSESGQFLQETLDLNAPE